MQTYYVLIATAVLVLGLVLYSTLQRVAQTSSSYRSSDLASLRLEDVNSPNQPVKALKKSRGHRLRSRVIAEYSNPAWNKRLSAVVSLQSAEDENASAILEQSSCNDWSDIMAHDDDNTRVQSPAGPVSSAPVLTYPPAITPAAVSEPVLTYSPSAVEETPAAMESIDSMDSTERSTYATYSAMPHPTISPEEASDLFTRLTPENLGMEEVEASPARNCVERRESFSNPTTAHIVEVLLIGFAFVALATPQRILSRERSPRGSRQQVA